MYACGNGDKAPGDPSDDNGIIEPPEDKDPPQCIEPNPVPDCTTAADCDDAFDPMPICQTAICDKGKCALTQAEDGTNCDDGNVCTDEETCQAGECTAGALICACDNEADCDVYNDENLCTGTFTCDTDLAEPRCIIDPQTVVTCTPPEDPCMVSECNPETGACAERAAADGTPCDAGDPCTQGDYCIEGACLPGAQNICECPEGMVAVGTSHCIDQYEASRPDATSTNRGQDSSRATSRAGVLPWMPVEYDEGRDACAAAGKRLCTADEFESACAGPNDTTYTYGNTYDPAICNGIDTYCRCDSGACADLNICPYPHCYNHGPDGTPGNGCGANLTLMPTGSFPGCGNDYGAFDLSGNVWELVDRGDGVSWYAGGAYNCFDAERLHQCGAIERNINARGFRCCADYGTGTPP